MTTKTAFQAKKKVLLTALFAIALVAVICALVLFDGVAYAASNRYDVTATRRSISAGVTETEYYTNTETNDDQVVTYTIEVDLSQNTLLAGYKNYDTGGNWGMDTVRNHVAAAERARGVKVVAAVNGDFFNMATGEPTGALVMDGRQVHASGGRIYFAILKDTNKAVIRTGELQGDEAEAIGAASMLIQDGTIVASADDTVKQPRTAVGIKEDGTVVLIVADGRRLIPADILCTISPANSKTRAASWPPTSTAAARRRILPNMPVRMSSRLQTALPTDRNALFPLR